MICNFVKPIVSFIYAEYRCWCCGNFRWQSFLMQIENPTGFLFEKTWLLQSCHGCCRRNETNYPTPAVLVCRTILRMLQNLYINLRSRAQTKPDHIPHLMSIFPWDDDVKLLKPPFFSLEVCVLLGTSFPSFPSCDIVEPSVYHESLWLWSDMKELTCGYVDQFFL